MVLEFANLSKIKELEMELQRVSRRNSEKMTVVDTLQNAYSKQDISEEYKDFLKEFFSETFDISKINKNQVEKLFAILREITDKVAKVNSHYPSDLDIAFQRLEEFWDGISRLDFMNLPQDLRLLFISHLTFHRETIADIIAEARSLLMEERRNFLKRLVSYHKEFAQWVKNIEKQLL